MDKIKKYKKMQMVLSCVVLDLGVNKYGLPGEYINRLCDFSHEHRKLINIIDDISVRRYGTMNIDENDVDESWLNRICAFTESIRKALNTLFNRIGGMSEKQREIVTIFGMGGEFGIEEEAKNETSSAAEQPEVLEEEEDDEEEDCEYACYIDGVFDRTVSSLTAAREFVAFHEDAHYEKV